MSVLHINRSGLKYPVIYAVANPVRGVLDRKGSQEHLQKSNESIKTRENDKNKGQKTRTQKEMTENIRRYL